ncbi:MAG: magnesium transporter [Chloroflexi bacterium]|jgi:magnesium transporter|nr:magnesium transporter [Chloroflexota bacterium]
MAVHLSQLIGKTVYDERNRALGRCLDVLVEERSHATPIVCALAVRASGAQELLVPAQQVAWLAPAIILTTDAPSEYLPRGNELWLRKNVLDRQIVDLEGHQLVRVNDIQLIRRGDGRYLLGSVAVGGASLMRRLGLEKLNDLGQRVIGSKVPDRYIPWTEVAAVQPNAPIRLRVSREKLQAINAADIADIVEELDRPSGVALLEMLDDEAAADAISEVEDELQPALLAALPAARAADVLEAMDPDDAADLLAALEEEDRQDYMSLMDTEESAIVGKLLAYPVDSAGGIMTTEYTTVPADLTVAEALVHLRTSPQAREDETMYYLHVVDVSGHLQGVASLRDLVMADPDARISEIMEGSPVTVDVLTNQLDVAQVVAKYNLLEVPVVDQEGVLHGIVTVDDAIDAVIPTAWKKRLPRFF